MTSGAWHYVLLLTFFLCHLSLTRSYLRAAEIASTKGHWRYEGDVQILNAELSQLITIKQRKLIQSGFTTYSRISIPLKSGESYQLDCTVKYDTWKETYSVVKFTAPTKIVTAKTFGKYAKTCLKLEMRSDSSQFSGLDLMKLRVRLYIEQISLNQAAKIKHWLVAQQSGLMQGLYSHMLGEMKLANDLEINIQIPDRKSRSQLKFNRPTDVLQIWEPLKNS